MNYYNEFDPKAAAWLRELIKEGEIPDGWVDERSITDVKPHELSPYIQHHFFAGIGGWSLALRIAGWPEDRPVRTGSCPCQPFSQAGQQKGTEDERHLWPVFRDIITFGESTVTFGEQVASKLGREWLAGIRADLEGLGYAVGAADLCAAGAGAPHIRQRLYWLSDSTCKQAITTNKSGLYTESCGGCATGGLADGDGYRLNSTSGPRIHNEEYHAESCRASSRLGDSHNSTEERFRQHGGEVVSGQQESDRRNDSNPWARFDILPCADGKARRVESGTFPLAHGVPGRVGLLRGYGNGIVPQVAAEFIKAYLETKGER